MSDTYEQLTIIQQFEFLRNDLNATAHIITYSPSSRDWDHVHDWLRRTAERVTTLEQQATDRIETLERELAEAKERIAVLEHGTQENNDTFAEINDALDSAGLTWDDSLDTYANHIRFLAKQRDDARDQLTTANATIAACKEAGFIDAEGRVRKVLGTLPVTEDGCIAGIGANLFYLNGRDEVISLPLGWRLEISQEPTWEGGEGFYSTPAAAKEGTDAQH